MSEPYLILHKVRGEPALDVAERIAVEDEEVWIIPTSGHRAFPYSFWSLSETAERTLIEGPDWAALPDHYQISAGRSEKIDEQQLRELLRELTLDEPKLTRRRLT